MSARTTAVRRAIAQAGERGLAHVASQQDTGTWISICGRQVRGQDIRCSDGPTAPDHAVALGVGFCGACSAIAVSIGGGLLDGIAVLLHVANTTARPQLREVPVDVVRVEPGRAVRPADAGLVHSVSVHGVLQPVVLRRTATGLVLVAGGRRLAAATLAGLESVPALVRDSSPEDAVLESLAENLHRLDLDPIAQAEAYLQALQQLRVSKEALADRVGVSRAQVSNTIRLLELPKALRDQVASGALSAAHGRELLRISDGDQQAALAEVVIRDGLTVRQTSTRRAGTEQEARQDLSALLTRVLAAQVRVTAGADRARITIDLDGGDLPRLLDVLGVAGVPA